MKLDDYIHIENTCPMTIYNKSRQMIHAIKTAVQLLCIIKLNKYPRIENTCPITMYN